MTLDLTLLAWTVALTFILAMVAATGASGQVGFGRLAGNREGLPEVTGWPGRAQRAHRNLLENLPLFIALVLIAHLARRTDGITLLGEEIFFVARVAHAIIYIAGIAWLRTGAFMVSVLGLVLIFVELL
jgi:uncharacterized MAPEG superfamily protein